jgi:hypothetical protein
MSEKLRVSAYHEAAAAAAALIDGSMHLAVECTGGYGADVVLF